MKQFTQEDSDDERISCREKSTIQANSTIWGDASAGQDMVPILVMSLEKITAK